MGSITKILIIPDINRRSITKKQETYSKFSKFGITIFIGIMESGRVNDRDRKESA
jgi:hypothetical protein